MEGKTRIEKAVEELVEAILEKIENVSSPDSIDNNICPYLNDYCPSKSSRIIYEGNGRRIFEYTTGTTDSKSDTICGG